MAVDYRELMKKTGRVTRAVTSKDARAIIAATVVITPEEIAAINAISDELDAEEREAA